MMPEQNLLENNQQLKKDLDAAIELIKRYEMMITELHTENANTLKKATHDLSNPLQILSMTIESLQDKAPAELQSTIERMKRSTDAMTSIILTLRKLRAVNNGQTKTAVTV